MKYVRVTKQITEYAHKTPHPNLDFSTFPPEWEAYYYDNIVGSYVENDLINAPKFPLLPDRKEKLRRSLIKFYFFFLCANLRPLR